MKRAVPIVIVLALLVAFSGTAVPAEPQPHIGLQNAWFTDADVSPYGVKNGVIVISGHWFLQEGTLGTDRQAFLKTRQPKVERRLREFLKRFREDSGHPFDRHTDAIIVIDIESPHPKDLWNCGEGPAEDEDPVEAEADPVMCPPNIRREIVNLASRPRWASRSGTPTEPPSTVTANFCVLYRKPWCSSALVP